MKNIAEQECYLDVYKNEESPLFSGDYDEEDSSMIGIVIGEFSVMIR